MNFDGIFKGGGALGTSYLGAVEYLQRNGHWFARTAGTSAGSIVAGLIGAGYTAVCPTRHDCTRPGHTECLKGLIYNCDSERIAHTYPSGNELKRLIPGSLPQIVLRLISQGIRDADTLPGACAGDRLPESIKTLLDAIGDRSWTIILPPPDDPAAAAIRLALPLLATLFSPAAFSLSTTVRLDPPAGGSWASYVIPAPPPPPGQPPAPPVTLVVWVPPGAPLPPGTTPSAGPVLPGFARVDFHVRAMIDELMILLCEQSLERLIDTNPVLPGGLHFRTLFQMLEEFGSYRSDRFHTWYNDAIVKRLVARFGARTFPLGSFPEAEPPATSFVGPTMRLGDLTPEGRAAWQPTFEQMFNLTGISATVIATDVLGTGMLVLNHEETPGLAVADAVIMSSSAPFVLFSPFPFPSPSGVDDAGFRARFNAKNRIRRLARNAPIADGGVVANFPNFIFSETAAGGPGAPYVTDADDDDRNRRKLGFYFDSRQPGEAVPAELEVSVGTERVQAFPVQGPPPDQQTPKIITYAMSLLEAARSTFEQHTMARLAGDPQKRLTVFLPTNPYSWIRFDFRDYEGADLAARGWIATRDACRAAGWFAPRPGTETPEPFTMVRCTPDSTAAAPSVALLDAQTVLVGFRANDPSNRIFFAMLAEQRKPPHIPIDDPTDTTPIRSERMLGVSSGTPFSTGTTRFAPRFARMGDRLYGFVVDPVAPGVLENEATPLRMFVAGLDASKRPDANIAPPELVAPGDPSATTRFAPAVAALPLPSGGVAFLAWVAADGALRVARLTLPGSGPGLPTLTGVLAVARDGAPLSPSAEVGIAIMEDALLIAWVEAGVIRLGRMDLTTGAVTDLVLDAGDQVGETGRGVSIAAVSYGDAPEIGTTTPPSSSEPDFDVTRTWNKVGWIVSWIAGAGNQIRYRLLRGDGKPAARAHLLVEDLFVHSSSETPAVVGAPIDFVRHVEDECGKIKQVNDENGESRVRIRSRWTGNAYFAWRANDPSGTLHVAQTTGLTVKE